MTLAFAGAVERLVEECLCAGAADIQVECFLLRLTRIGYFARSRILWFGAEVGPHALTQLVDCLRECLANCGLQPDLRIYRPHLTLLRNAEPVPREAEVTPIDWPVRTFYLIESQTKPEGAQYEVLREFALRN
jgi:2'-5' RNA ligase